MVAGQGRARDTRCGVRRPCAPAPLPHRGDTGCAAGRAAGGARLIINTKQLLGRWAPSKNVSIRQIKTCHGSIKSARCDVMSDATNVYRNHLPLPIIQHRQNEDHSANSFSLLEQVTRHAEAVVRSQVYDFDCYKFSGASSPHCISSQTIRQT